MARVFMKGCEAIAEAATNHTTERDSGILCKKNAGS